MPNSSVDFKHHVASAFEHGHGGDCKNSVVVQTGGYGFRNTISRRINGDHVTKFNPCTIVHDGCRAGCYFGCRQRVGWRASGERLLSQRGLKLKCFTVVNGGILLPGDCYADEYFSIGVKGWQCFGGVVGYPLINPCRILSIPDLNGGRTQGIGRTRDVFQYCGLARIACDGKDGEIRAFIYRGATDSDGTVIIQRSGVTRARRVGGTCRVARYENGAGAIVIDAACSIHAGLRALFGDLEDEGFLALKCGVLRDGRAHQQGAARQGQISVSGVCNPACSVVDLKRAFRVGADGGCATAHRQFDHLPCCPSHGENRIG